MKTLWSCIIFALLLLVQLTGPVKACDHDNSKGGEWYWSLKQKLQASDEPRASDLFGFAIAVDGNIALVGAPLDDDKGENAGAAYVYVREERGSWQYKQKLYADDAAAGDRFGKHVAMSGSTALIGSMRGAYFFDRCSECKNWSQTHQVNAADGTVSVSGDIALVGDPSYDNSRGRVFVYERLGGVWIQKMLEGEIVGDKFGCSVAASGESATILIGACGAGGNAGAAYVFAGTICPLQNCSSYDLVSYYPSCCGRYWSQQAKLVSNDADSGDQFGYSVSLSLKTEPFYLDIAVIGAPGDNDNNGAAYIFIHNSGGTWGQQAKLTAIDGYLKNCFGRSVAEDGNVTMIGAHCYNSTPAGAAYIFVGCMACGGWFPEAHIKPIGPEWNYFGWSVALSGDDAFVGAHADNDDFSGSVYVFRRGKRLCAHCPAVNLLLK